MFNIVIGTGWNAERVHDSGPQQRFFYMKHIQAPPTRTDVAKETMKRSLKVAQECGDTFGLVSYDLAIAKIAKQLQREEVPAFDSLFIMFGAFHTQMAVFPALGRMIEGRGGPYILSEARLITAGSISKFLNGKVYNRCKRGHILLSTAMHGLNWERFVDDLNIPSAKILDLATLSDQKDMNIPENIKLLLAQHDLYLQQTLAGEREKTAQFWMTYASFVDLFLILQRAMKENDVDLYGYALFKISSIFFITNRQNYARWMTYYLLELNNHSKTRPDVYNALKSGGFSVKRTENHFSQVGVDMSLEQTINAQSKNRMKGIMQYADVPSAVNRWLVTNSMKAKLVNIFLEQADMQNIAEPSKETRKSSIVRDQNCLSELKR